MSFFQDAYAHEGACEVLDLTDLYRSVSEYDVIVLAEVGNILETSPKSIQLHVVAYFKGPPTAHVLMPMYTDGHCEAQLSSGDIVVAALRGFPGAKILWPSKGSVFFIKKGNVFDNEGSSLGFTREQFIEVLRESTGQYAIPAKLSSEAASLNIRSVIIPVLIAAVCILGIGLFLQRIWQKIDPE